MTTTLSPQEFERIAGKAVTFATGMMRLDHHDREDFMQVAREAMLDCQARYNPDHGTNATIKTFAYKAAARAVRRYQHANRSAVRPTRCRADRNPDFTQRTPNAFLHDVHEAPGELEREANLRVDVELALRKVPESERAALMEFVIGDFNSREIARRHGLTVARVHRLKRAWFPRLRRVLESYA